jgi:hypothetical protein
MNTNDITRKNAVLIFEWCKKTFGLSSINGTYPRLVFHKKRKDIAGYYDPWKNEIHVCKPKHRTFMGFIGTIIHEYTHYHQSIKRQYFKLDKIYSYKNHPLEREANRTERKYKWMCYYETFSPNEAMKDI